MKALTVEKLTLKAGSFSLGTVSLNIEQGEYFVLMGMTGTGKSLFLKAVCGLARIATCRILINGHDVTDKEPRFRNIGYVPQNGGLFPHLNVRANIRFPMSLKAEKTDEAEREYARIVKYLKVEALLDRSVVNLSGGEQQKVALARALTTGPELLVLDEPVCALDEPTRYEICHDLCRAQKEFGVATLHVCHSLEEAELVSDRIGIMDGGQLIATGTLSELSGSEQSDSVRKLFVGRNRNSRERKNA